ncbi:MAG: hypothetical protein HY897_00340 [Deltaproteobacteria bacterium]|nr:hypothetical protein [Deltaproteobacteria bacterium]
MESTGRVFLVGVLVFALAGAAFAAVSSSDFVAHLDRQVHAISCSYAPGAGGLDETGSSGCYTALMSPFSSVLRAQTWGGIPIALPGLALFAYLFFIALYFSAAPQAFDRHSSRFLVLATLLPVGASAYYLYVSVSIIGAVCKLCVGMYVASGGVFLFSVFAHLGARRARFFVQEVPWGRYAGLFAEGVLFVAVPVALYLALKPLPAAADTQCGSLMYPEDKYGVMVRVNRAPGGRAAIEVIDPLCPACAAFAGRLGGTEYLSSLDIRGVMFPLDKECNWMVPQTVHPGACAVSEAVLCAGNAKAKDVLAWAFAENEKVRTAAKNDPQAGYAAVKKAFPDLSDCLGGAEVKSRLNKSLRWAVSNALPVSTPQLFVDGRRLCEEDTDLGLEYALRTLMELPAALGRDAPAASSPAAQAPKPADGKRPKAK